MIYAFEMIRVKIFLLKKKKNFIVKSSRGVTKSEFKGKGKTAVVVTRIL